MKRAVVDASVAVKWFFPEAHSAEALRLLGRGKDLLAPDLILAEMGNVVWKRWRRQELITSEAEALIRDFSRLPLRLFSHSSLAEAGWVVAATCRCTFYDAMYIALALREDCPMVTADKRLVESLAGTPFENSIRWVGESGWVPSGARP